MFDGLSLEGLVGRTFSGFRVTRFIARGGMGLVYEGIQESLNRRVAIKFLYPHLSADENFRERFAREARSVGKLNHPNIVSMLDTGSEGILHYMVMDYVDGESLRDRLAKLQDEGMIPSWTAVTMIVRQIGSALAYTHGLGYVHRDVKPGNILLTENGRALLTDFGVVKVVGTTGLTVTGAMIGTPEYMAPEQSLGTMPVGPAADQYSLAVIAYQMMTGRVPFHAPTPAAMIRMHANEPPLPPSSFIADFPLEIEAVLMRGLAKNPNDRYESVDSFVEDLTAAVNASPITAGETMLATMHTIAPAVEDIFPLGDATTPGVIDEEPAVYAPEDDDTDHRKRRWTALTAIIGAFLIGLAIVCVLLVTARDDGGPPVEARGGGEAVAQTETGMAEAGADESPTPTEDDATPTATSQQTATPEPTETPTPTSTATPSPSPTTTATPTPTPTHTPTPTPTPTPVPAAPPPPPPPPPPTPTATATATPTPTPIPPPPPPPLTPELAPPPPPTPTPTPFGFAP